MDAASSEARVIELLERLVSFNTENPPGNELEAAGFLSQFLKGQGFVVQTQSLAEARANVIAQLKNGPGPILAFCSHMDVVPAGQGWSHAPFKLTARHNRLYGRGACDAKGSIAAMVEGLMQLKASRENWRGTLLGVFVADEEVNSIGARRFVEDGPPIDFVVVGEPTSNATATAHKGCVRPVIRVHGETAHSGTPDLGTNAISQAMRLLTLVEHLHHDVCTRRHPLVGNAALSVTRINGGTADNVVPGYCDIVLDRRMLPGEETDAVCQELQRLINAAEREFGVRSEIIEFRSTSGPSETPGDRALVRTAMSVCAQHGIDADKPVGLAGGCDLVHFRSSKTDGVVLGPGSLSVAHKPNEFVSVNELINASVIYRDLALAMFHQAGTAY